MRPRGEIREALAPAFERLAPCGWRDVLTLAPIDVRSPSEVRLVQKTVENMVLAGELVSVGQAKAAGARVWHALYEPAAWQAQAEPCTEQMREDSLRAIGVITGAWVQTVP